MADWDWRIWLWIGVGLGVLVYLAAEWRNRGIRRRVAECARLLDLEARDGRFDGMMGDHRVTGTVVGDHGRRGWLLLGTHVRLQVEVAGTVARRLKLRWQHLVGPADRDSIATGDPMFDSTIAVAGDEAEVLAVFDGPTRRAALDLYVGAPFTLSEGRINVLRGGLVEHPPLMEIVVRRLVGWANTLDPPPASIPERLATMVETDSEAAVCANARRVLLRRFNTTGAARRIATPALDDDDPMIRLWAAMALGPERLDTIVQALESTALPPSVRTEAFAYLVDHAPSARVMPLASKLFHERGDDFALALAEHLWRVEHPAAPGIIARLLADATASGTVNRIPSGAPGNAQTAAKAAAKTALAAVSSLGRCGTVEQVPELTRLAERSGSNPELRRAARTAVAHIQARLEGAGAGQLAVAAGGFQEGAMALVGWDLGLDDDADETPPDG